MKTMNKKGWLVRDFVVAGIIFGVVIALFILGLASTALNYNRADLINSDFAAHYNKLTTTLDKVNNATNAVQGRGNQSGGISLIGSFDVAYNSVFAVISMVWDLMIIYPSMIANIPGDFPMFDKSPMIIFLAGLTAIVLVILVFVWLSSVMRGKI